MAGEQTNHRVLEALDTAKTQWYHFTAIFVAGMGFFTDAYDIFAINIASSMLGYVYGHSECAVFQ